VAEDFEDEFQGGFPWCKYRKKARNAHGRQATPLENDRLQDNYFFKMLRMAFLRKKLVVIEIGRNGNKS
jgi:hypothetical protein